jgi:hypothetical protein
MHCYLRAWSVGRLRGAAACFALCTAACSNDDAATLASAKWLPEPVAVGTRLSFIDAEHDRAWWLELAQTTEPTDLHATSTTLPANPLAAVARSSESVPVQPELLVLSAGLRGVDMGPQLIALNERRTRGEYALQAPYTAFTSSDDGHYALAYFDQGTRSTAFAPAQVAVIDLTAKTSVSEVGLEVEGHAATRVWLTPSMRVGQRTLQLAVASFPRQLALLDLANPSAGPVIVSLSGDDNVTLDIQELVFVPERGRIVLLAAELDDVVVVTLNDAPNARRHFEVQLNQYAAGAAPLAVLAAGGKDYAGLAVLSAAGSVLRALDADSGDNIEQTLEAPADALLGCDAGCKYALAYALGSTQVSLIDLERLRADEPDAIQTRTVEANVAGVVTDLDHGRVYLRHMDSALTLVDLGLGTLLPLAVSSSSPAALRVAPDGALWVAKPGDYLVARFDPSTRETREVLLAKPIESLVFVEAAERAVVVHAASELTLSVLDAIEPARVAALRVRSAD